jgi:2-methylcitrate dehydratase PrpD
MLTHVVDCMATKDDIASLAETADHSLPYIVARAMFDGDINLRSFDPESGFDALQLGFWPHARFGSQRHRASRLARPDLPQ